MAYCLSSSPLACFLVQGPGCPLDLGHRAPTQFHQGASNSHTHTRRLSPEGPSASLLVRALSEAPVKPEISKHKQFPLMLMLRQPQSQGYEQIKDILGGPYLTPQLPAAASGWLQPYLPCLVLLQLGVGIEVLPTLGTGPCPQFLGVGRQGAALSSTLGGGPRVPAWAEGQLSPEIAEPGHPLSF